MHFVRSENKTVAQGPRLMAKGLLEGLAICILPKKPVNKYIIFSHLN